MKILIVDDEMVSRKKMEKIMDNFGEYESANNGDDAIATFKSSYQSGVPFDMIALDVEMPGKNGTEVLCEFRAIEQEHAVPQHLQAKVLMVTAHSDKDTVLSSIQAGCDDYIVKPFNKETVMEKLKKLGFSVS
ncbi:MAG: response regulator [SAR324 cluster bacterium]|nr:response regulator [SAR324 cluster bacterium]